MLSTARLWLIFSLALLGIPWAPTGRAAGAAGPDVPRNLFANPSFELGGTGPWRMDKGGQTAARLELAKGEAVEGQRCMRVTVEKVESWGTQFGQTIEAGHKGKTYTFAVMAKAVAKPVTVDLQIERRAKPYDRAAKSGRLTLTPDKWQELHVTFNVAKDFPQGWFAYISCGQAGAQYLADVFRLHEGDYVPYEEVAREQAMTAGVRLFDTGMASAAPLTADALRKRPGWTELPEDETAHRFKGDAVLLNNRLAVVLRRRGAGGEVHSLGAAPKLRAVLAPVGKADAVSLAAVAIVENSQSRAAVDATFSAARGGTTTVRYELSMGQAFVRTAPRKGVTGLRVEAPCRFAVLPDFFADDIVVDATALPVAKADLPSENLLLHMLGDGDAIVMAVSKSRDNDVRVALSGEGKARRINASEIRYGKDGSIWVAVIAGPGTWHARDVAPGDAGKVLRLDWRMPYPAQWRVDWLQDSGLGDSWEMALERPNGGYVRHGWFGSPSSLPADRKRWTTVLGRFFYPCWIDRRGQGWLQPLSKVLRFQGPALLYPINRVGATPLDTFTVVDIVRATLGVGPCEYILDVESHKEGRKGRATCAIRDTLRGIYKAAQQKQKRKEVEKALVDVMVFIRHIRGRIEHYVAFGHEALKYLAEQKRAHPDLAKPIGELEALARAIEERAARRKAKIKTPDDAARLVAEFKRTVLDHEGPEAYARCKRITAAWVDIGGNQDELVGECRMAVKILRQRAGLLMATDPRTRPIATEIRRRTQQALRNPTSYEAPRH